jgi:hypothetical protein
MGVTTADFLFKMPFLKITAFTLDFDLLHAWKILIKTESVKASIQLLLAHFQVKNRRQLRQQRKLTCGACYEGPIIMEPEELAITS